MLDGRERILTTSQEAPTGHGVREGTRRPSFAFLGKPATVIWRLLPRVPSSSAHLTLAIGSEPAIVSPRMHVSYLTLPISRCRMSSPQRQRHLLRHLLFVVYSYVMNHKHIASSCSGLLGLSTYLILSIMNFVDRWP